MALPGGELLGEEGGRQASPASPDSRLCTEVSAAVSQMPSETMMLAEGGKPEKLQALARLNPAGKAVGRMRGQLEEMGRNAAPASREEQGTYPGP